MSSLPPSVAPAMLRSPREAPGVTPACPSSPGRISAGSREQSSLSLQAHDLIKMSHVQITLSYVSSTIHFGLPHTQTRTARDLTWLHSKTGLKRSPGETQWPRQRTTGHRAVGTEKLVECTQYRTVNKLNKSKQVKLSILLHTNISKVKGAEINTNQQNRLTNKQTNKQTLRIHTCSVNSS